MQDRVAVLDLAPQVHGLLDQPLVGGGARGRAGDRAFERLRQLRLLSLLGRLLRLDLGELVVEPLLEVLQPLARREQLTVGRQPAPHLGLERLLGLLGLALQVVALGAQRLERGLQLLA